MPSSKDPVAPQEFKSVRWPPEAAEDSDLISALAKLVNEADANAEDGLRTESWVTVQAIRYASPPRPAIGASAPDGNLSDSASRKHATRDAALCSFRIYRKDIRASAQPRLKNPGPSTETDFPGSVMCERLNLGLARFPGRDDAGTASFHRNAVLSLPVIASRDHLHDPRKEERNEMVELIEKPPPETGRLGAKVLSFPDVIAQSVGFMGPVFTSAFVIPLVVGVASVTGKGGGIASPLSVLIAGIGVFAIGWIVSSYAKEVRTAGSLYEYVSRGLGERIGTAAGWLYYAGVTMLTAALLLILGGYLQSAIASEFSVNPLPGWAWSLIFLAIVALVLYFGVRISTRVQLALALISIIVVTVFFISVIVKLGSANSFKPFRPSSSADGWPGIFFGVLYGILLFTGFESSANLAEETPTRIGISVQRSCLLPGSQRSSSSWPPTSKWPASTTA